MLRVRRLLELCTGSFLAIFSIIGKPFHLQKIKTSNCHFYLTDAKIEGTNHITSLGENKLRQRER